MSSLTVIWNGLMLYFWIAYAKISERFQHRKKVCVYGNILSCSLEGNMHHGEVAVVKDSVRTSVLKISVCVCLCVSLSLSICTYIYIYMYVYIYV